MNNLSSIQKQELRACKTQTIINCGLTTTQLEARVGNPAGTNKPDMANPQYKGKVVFINGKLHINLNYILTGNIARAEIGLKNIKEVFSNGGVIVNFKPNLTKVDIRIHGATLLEITQGLNFVPVKQDYLLAVGLQHPIIVNGVMPCY